MAASLLLHLTPESSGYFENVWAWVADHDIDFSVYPSNVSTAAQVSVYSGRGVLIESQGPTWLYGSASEHSVLYQYQLLNAKDVSYPYLIHCQIFSAHCFYFHD
jgi:glucan 1,3-beta-glucosidase